MLDLDTSAQTSLSDGSDGVAPHSGLSHLIDDSIIWVGRHQYGWQFGEQGVIEAIIDVLEEHIDPDERWAVEFGVGDGTRTQVTINPLIDRRDWRAILIEADKDRAARIVANFGPNVRIVNERVSVDGDGSIDKQLARAGCPLSPAVMVVDIDSYEYHIVKAMKARPHVLCVETLDLHCNVSGEAHFIPDADDCGKFFEGRNGDLGFRAQASASAFDALLHDMEYKLVFRSRVNSIYVRGDSAKKLRRVCLNLGCGDIILPGHDNLDIKTGTDIRHLPYNDGSVDEIYASHILEHFPLNETDALLKEWLRVLKPNGIIRLAVPDMKKVMAEIQKEDPLVNHNHITLALYGSGTEDGDMHKAAFTKETLTLRMYNAGIGSIEEFKAFTLDSSADPYSLNLMGRKRHFAKLENPKVALVLSQPRFTFTGHETALLKLAQSFKFEVEESKGSFWERDMDLTIESAINKYDPDILLFSDYDSKFEPSDVHTLMETLNNNPHIAAIGAIQPSRHHDSPLVLDVSLDYSGDITRVKYQHFGLMAIRRDVFEEVPRPWFISVPGKNDKGEWDWKAYNRSDGDISFWRSLDMLGFQVYQHNKVNIGHITQCIKYVRDKGKGVQYVPIEVYQRHGKPKDAVFNVECYRTKPTTEPVKNG